MRARQEGTKAFETLVQQGEKLERRTKMAAAETAGAATAKAKEMQEMAGGTWDKLEQVFEDRVAKALSKLGVYTQNDLQRLAARVDELADAVNKLVKSGAGGKAVPPAAERKRGATERKSGKRGRSAAKSVATAGKRAPK